MRPFIIFQFIYCRFIWMTHSRGLNNKINHIHKQAARIIYKHFSTCFEVLLAKYQAVAIHNPNVQQLVIEIFKMKMEISPVIMREIFNFSNNNNYNFRSGTHVSSLK